jgi:hypothetical protein
MDEFCPCMLVYLGYFMFFFIGFEVENILVLLHLTYLDNTAIWVKMICELSDTIWKPLEIFYFHSFLIFPFDKFVAYFLFLYSLAS